jgi:hypothetical protein
MKDMRLWNLRNVVKMWLEETKKQDFLEGGPHMQTAILLDITDKIVEVVKINFCDPDAEEPGR